MFRAEVRGQETFSVVSMVLRSTLGVGTHGHDADRREKKNNNNRRFNNNRIEKKKKKKVNYDDCDTKVNSRETLTLKKP